MPFEDVDFREKLAGYPGLQALPREELVRAVYLRDRHILPDDLKRLFESVSVIRIPVAEAEEISLAIGVATGEIASVNLGLASDSLHYVRTQLAMMRDRELSVDWGPKEDPFDGEVLPHLDGFHLDLSNLKGISLDEENGTVRCEVGTRWKDVFDTCASQGWLFPLFPIFPHDHLMGDIVAGTAILTSYSGGPERYVRNIDFLAADTRYGESGFDQVPNNASGYDLNSLLLAMGRNLAVPVSVTFTLLPAVEAVRIFRYAPESMEDLVASLRGIAGSQGQPLKVIFGDGTASKVSLGGNEGLTVEVALRGTEETLPVQQKQLDSAFKKETKKTEVDGLAHPLVTPTKGRGPTPLVEVRASLADVQPLVDDIVAWAEGQGPGLGIIGTLSQGGTAGLLPFAQKPLNRGERFDRVLELVQIARKHRCRLRYSPLLHLLSPESNMEKRFNLARRIKERVDLPNVINPSNVLWVPRGL